MNSFNQFFNRRASPRQLQLLVWGTIFLVNFFSLLPMDGLLQSSIYTILNTFFYAVIIYGNINFLFPRLYRAGSLGWYILIAIVLLAAIGFLKTWISQLIYNTWFAKKYYALTWENIIYVTVGCAVVFILSFVFRIALAYFALKQQAQQIEEQKSQVELNLLKSQVQPHFLFNTLNNIYYEAFREAPRTALLIGRLSEIMRYFVDESPKEKVALSTEIQFLENYIALEKIRIRHGVDVTFTKEGASDPMIPPMLLMTFVENIFKHGIDRSGTDNKVNIWLSEKDGYLIFQTDNELPETPVLNSPQGFGLKNLQKRLTLLYGGNAEMTTFQSERTFHTWLKIPLI
ncbi:MAG TPA: histidine kinase [Puia sp.]